MRSLPSLILASALATAACGSSTPANVAGTFTVAVTNRANGCMLANWTVGDMASGIGVTITQMGGSATASVNVPIGTYLDVVLGDHQFMGSVNGDFINLTLLGTRAQSAGTCTYTYNAVLSGTLTGDVLQGTIDYEAKTNGNPDCTSMGITGCASIQDFNGTRPPT